MTPFPHTSAVPLSPQMRAAQSAAMGLLLAEVTALCALMQGRLPAFGAARPAPAEAEDRFDNMPV